MSSQVALVNGLPAWLSVRQARLVRLASSWNLKVSARSLMGRGVLYEAKGTGCVHRIWTCDHLPPSRKWAEIRCRAITPEAICPGETGSSSPPSTPL